MSGRSSGAWLLIDAGNTRVKWALHLQGVPRGTVFADRGVIELAALRRSDAPLRRLLAAAPSETRVFACNVAGAAFGAQLRAAANRAGLRPPQFARSARSAAGVRNSYAQPWRLGSDRWVSLIGARALWPRRALCIIGIGSALTVDLLRADGRHGGGCIVPGPRMMIESLLRDTAGIGRRARLGSTAAVGDALMKASRSTADTLFMRDTRDALIEGARHTCAALIERAAQQARAQLGGRVRVLLAGGATGTILPLLHLRCQREDDLVLRGLMVLAQAATTIA